MDGLLADGCVRFLQTGVAFATHKVRENIISFRPFSIVSLECGMPLMLFMALTAKLTENRIENDFLTNVTRMLSAVDHHRPRRIFSLRSVDVIA